MANDTKIRGANPELAEHLMDIDLPYWKHNRNNLRKMSQDLIYKINKLVWEAREGKCIDDCRDDLVKGIELLFDQASLVSIEQIEKRTIEAEKEAN